MNGKWVVVVVAVLVVTQSMSVEGKCGPFETVKEALTSYDLPGGLFPDYVESFSCAPILDTNSYSIALRLRSGGCSVTKEGDVAEFKQEVSAVISNRRLTRLKGMSLELGIPELETYITAPYNLTLTINAVKVSQISGAKIVQFGSIEGIFGPPFPFQGLPSHPPQCDHAVDLNTII